MESLFSLHPFHAVQQEKGKGMAKTQKKFFPLPLLGWRVRIFRLNLEPPGSKDKNVVIISYFGGWKNRKTLPPSLAFGGRKEDPQMGSARIQSFPEERKKLPPPIPKAGIGKPKCFSSGRLTDRIAEDPSAPRGRGPLRAGVPERSGAASPQKVGWRDLRLASSH
jgi:hypothetical protein